MQDWLFRDKVEVGFVLGSEFWGRGYATGAAQATPFRPSSVSFALAWDTRASLLAGSTLTSREVLTS